MKVFMVIESHTSNEAHKINTTSAGTASMLTHTITDANQEICCVIASLLEKLDIVLQLNAS